MSVYQPENMALQLSENRLVICLIISELWSLWALKLLRKIHSNEQKQ